MLQIYEKFERIIGLAFTQIDHLRSQFDPCYTPSVALRAYQQCREVDAAIVEVWVPSSSHPEQPHRVIIMDRDDPAEGICDCEGFTYRGKCKHLDEAESYTCGWVEGMRPNQSAQQQQDKVCPVCGGKTEWIMIEED